MIAYDRAVGLHQVRLSELDLRCQCLETANYDGMLVWKISDYVERKLQAVEGRVLSLYSQPFYTSRYGYKMCARVYLNGDGAGRNTYLSLFFVVMQVNYTCLLPAGTVTDTTAMIADCVISQYSYTEPSVRWYAHVLFQLHADGSRVSIAIIRVCVIL